MKNFNIGDTVWIVPPHSMDFYLKRIIEDITYIDAEKYYVVLEDNNEFFIPKVDDIFENPFLLYSEEDAEKFFFLEDPKYKEIYFTVTVEDTIVKTSTMFQEKNEEEVRKKTMAEIADSCDLYHSISFPHAQKQKLVRKILEIKKLNYLGEEIE